MTVKKLCILVVLTTILFVQEEVLTIIPSVQLTFFLIILYGACLGMVYGSFIVVAHVLLDNLFMASFGVFTIVPMIIGYEITLLFGYLLGKKNEFIIAIFAGLAAIIYCSLFIPIGVYVYGYSLKVYVIADIPFTAVMVTCNVLTILFLYKPLYKVLNDLLKNTEIKNKEVEA